MNWRLVIAGGMSLVGAVIHGIVAWLERFRHFWVHRLEALATEITRGKRKR